MSRLLDQFTADTAALISDTDGVAEAIVVVDGTTTTVRGVWREQDPTEDEADRGRNRVRRAEAWIPVADHTPSRTATYALATDASTTWVLDEQQRDTAGGLWHLILHRSERIEAGPRAYRRGA